METGKISQRNIHTPLGTMLAVAGVTGLVSLSFTENEADSITSNNQADAINQTILDHLSRVEEELLEYFKGLRKTFSVLVDPQGTEFQKKVWHQLKGIEFGQTITYKQQAERFENPKGIRAIASANGQNPIAIIIPCHRVVGSDGNLTGYAGGLQRKKWLLDFEKEKSGQTLQLSLFS